MSPTETFAKCVASTATSAGVSGASPALLFVIEVGSRPQHPRGAGAFGGNHVIPTP
jgi:hypothetical protein